MTNMRGWELSFLSTPVVGGVYTVQWSSAPTLLSLSFFSFSLCSVCLPAHLSVCLSACLFAFLFAFLPLCLSVCLLIYLINCLFPCLSLSLSVVSIPCLPLCPYLLFSSLLVIYAVLFSWFLQYIYILRSHDHSKWSWLIHEWLMNGTSIVYRIGCILRIVYLYWLMCFPQIFCIWLISRLSKCTRINLQWLVPLFHCTDWLSSNVNQVLVTLWSLRSCKSPLIVQATNTCNVRNVTPHDSL